MKLTKIITITGTMTCVSGLHIGGNSDGTKVGGSDNPIIKNPVDGKPYIPGSSVKGVMRSILEKSLDIGSKKENHTFTKDGKDLGYNGSPCRCGKPGCMACTLFGAHINPNPTCGEPRLRVFDMQLNKEFEETLINRGMSFYDIIENVSSTMINRNTGTASGGALRSTERLAAGAKFDCKFVVKIFEGDNEKKILSTVENLITRLEDFGLGAKTSSGSGVVKFDINWDDVQSEPIGF